MAKYSNYNNIFLAKNAAKLPDNSRINEYAIKLGQGKQPLFGSIYSLKLVELKMLKTYIKTNLANDFIFFFKSPIGAPILFVRKPDRSFRLCLNYLGLNNLTIKNQYPLPLIGESVN